MGTDVVATLGAAVVMLPFMLFWILYPNWGSTLYGEVRGAGDFRKVLQGMLGGIWVDHGLAIVFVLLAAKTFGWDFLQRDERQLHQPGSTAYDDDGSDQSRSGATR